MRAELIVDDVELAVRETGQLSGTISEIVKHAGFDPLYTHNNVVREALRQLVQQGRLRGTAVSRGFMGKHYSYVLDTPEKRLLDRLRLKPLPAGSIEDKYARELSLREIDPELFDDMIITFSLRRRIVAPVSQHASNTSKRVSNDYLYVRLATS